MITKAKIKLKGLKNTLIFSLSFLVLTLNFSKLASFNRSFFYRTSSFWDEPRFQLDALSTLNIELAGGSTYCGKNGCSETTSIFDIYKNSNILVPNNLENNLLLSGYFNVLEADFNLYQNLSQGFFWHFHLPILSTHLTLLDISPKNKNKDSKLTDPNSLLKINNRFTGTQKKTGLSDSSMFFGWSSNYEDTTYLDFVDTALQIGVLFPTATTKRSSELLDIPLGYNGHYGITWISDISFGAYEWLTLGLHCDGVGFFDKNLFLDIKKKEFKLKSGTVFRFGSYFKADHICWGLSLLMGFSFEQKNSNYIKNPDQTIKCLNCEYGSKKWNRWIYNFLLEYDFAEESRLCHNRVALIYSHQITGKRVFNTNMIGGYLGLDISWYF